MTELLQSVNPVSISVRILLALLIGGLLGLERGRSNRPAGFRTYLLVCLGATLVMLTNQYVYQTFSTSDPVRLDAQVISGIGFLGAGSIIVTGRHQIKGITTAAGMWTSACCGLAIGIGFYTGAIIAGLLIFIIMANLRSVDNVIKRHTTMIEIYLEFDNKKPLSEFLTYIRKNQFDIVDMQIGKNKYAKDMGLYALITLTSKVRRPHHEMLALISGSPGVKFIEEL